MHTIDEATSTAQPALTCLIVDDSAFMRLRLRLMMESLERVSTSEAANGTEAIQEYGRLKPDIVLMDIIMPGMEGVETVKKICEADPNARVIMISSLSHKEKIAEAKAAGARYFIPKPVTPEELRKAMNDVLSSPETNRSAGNL